MLRRQAVVKIEGEIAGLGKLHAQLAVGLWTARHPAATM